MIFCFKDESQSSGTILRGKRTMTKGDDQILLAVFLSHDSSTYQKPIALFRPARGKKLSAKGPWGDDPADWKGG